jgi:hypothetical protein
MKHQVKDIKKIELFAPGTAGERALRIETADRVEIYDEEKEIEIKDYDSRTKRILKKE